MTSEIRVNKLTNRIGLSTVTFADSGIGLTVTGRIDPDTIVLVILEHISR